MSGSSATAASTEGSLSPYSLVLQSLKSQRAMHLTDKVPDDPDPMSIDVSEADDQSDSEAPVPTETHGIEANGEDETIPDSDSTQHMAPEKGNDNTVSSEEHACIEASIEDQHAQVVTPPASVAKKAKRGWLQQACDASFVAGEPKQFECAHHILDTNGQPCDTRQEYYSPRETARPVIAHFFGHNKNEWDQIPKEERIYLCRKHYQKLWHYGDLVENPLAYNAKPSMQLKLIRIMLDRIEHWRSDAKFTLKLSKSMDDKTKHYHELVSGGMSVQEAAAQVDEIRRDVKTEPQEEVKVEQQAEERDGAQEAQQLRRKARSRAKGKIDEKTPVLFALGVKRRYEGGNKSPDDIRAIYDWLEAKLADGTIRTLPAIETLLDLSADRMPRKKPNKPLAPSNHVKVEKSEVQGQSTSATVHRDASPVAGPSTATPIVHTHIPVPATTFRPINVPEPAPRLTPLQQVFSQIRQAILNSGIDMSGFTIRLEGPAAEEMPDSTTADSLPHPTIVLKRLNGGRNKGKGKIPARPIAAATKARSEKRKRDERSSEVDAEGRGDSMEPAKRFRQDQSTEDDSDGSSGASVKEEMEEN